MNTFLTCKGHIVEINPENGNSSLYKVGELETKVIGDGQLLLIESIDLEIPDAVTPKDALNDAHALYIYGTTFGHISIKGTLYLGKGTSDKKVITTLSNWFAKNRVTVKKDAVNVSIADKFKCQAYIIKLRFGQTDSRINAMSFIIDGLVKPTKLAVSQS